MYKSLFTLMYRQFFANKFYSLIKILCLSVGMTVSLLILFYVYNEFSFDGFHINKDSIYQMVVTNKSRDNIDKSSIATAGIGPSLLSEFHEIKKMTRLSTPHSEFFVDGNKSIIADDLVFADSSFLNIFTFNLLSGNPDLALDEPFTMVITPHLSKTFFGDENPIGKILKYQDKYNFKITGVIQKAPSNSHISYNAVLSFSSLYKMDGYYLGWDGGWSYYTYVLATDQINSDNFKKKLIPFLDEHINNKYRNYGSEISLAFDRLSLVYLHSQAPETQIKSGNTANLYVFMSIALFILIIACINFINLSTAQASQRLKETGIKKVLGAGRGLLIRHFMIETILVSFVALILSLLLTELFLPGFSKLFHTELNFAANSLIKLTGAILIIGLLTGFLAGSYPAFFLSGVSPEKALKGRSLSINKGKTFRNILVVVQFFLATGLIICTLIVYQQVTFINNKDLGYNKANYLVLSLTGKKSISAYKLLKNKLKSIPQVLAIGSTTAIPGIGLTSNGYIPEDQTESMMFSVMDVDADFLNMLEINTIRGFGLSENSGTKNNILVNEALIKKLGWENPIGKTISRNGKLNLVGVVKDFHFAPLHHTIAPLVITNKPWEGHQDGFDYLVIRYSPNDAVKVVAETEKIWKAMFPAEPFIFSFMDQMLDSMYANERNFGKIFIWASILAIFIAGLGLYGLTTFITQKRRKEIGIRKTFGANSAKIVWLLGKQFVILVIIGNLLAWPMAWLVMQRWLENYAFIAPIGWWIYGATLGISTVIAFSTVAWHSIKASHQNPVDALRYE